MIKPTVGRIVHYWPSLRDPGPDPKGQPLAAIVAHVHSDVCVNLSVSDANGYPFNRTNVRLLQAGEDRPDMMGFCEWMPYQLGQAAKTEAAEAKLNAKPAKQQ